ncbi:hypothetical protein VOLCADRAFT_116733 [Volvox carteri f. nagariensis]|uniref:Uncharacterized protein n=1 Tax=Volvox carteri f. nagariensis TaxID=3068 RepID=D8TP71_VOLCA|nr:uncharacterized protein VOLCADRAFT_116733 [Volvox carteri f. nagariensis]EFJ50710.1 hypothetical protein VOLCADRAFT_116733 [Volvox carteri f. nagariensis]|eukprot:XP_002948303.1 hypothetical protein VOLCADRAFT_116733 [Volvox carteri f. nagariensis]
MSLVPPDFCDSSSPGPRRAGSLPASPSQLHTVPPGPFPHAAYPGLPICLSSQDPPTQAASSPAKHAQPFPHMYQMSIMGQQQHLAALDLAAAAHSPSGGALQTSPSRMLPSPNSGMPLHGAQHPYLGYDAGMQQYCSQHPQRLHPPGQQHSSVHGLVPSFPAAAGPGTGSDAVVAGNQHQNHPYNMAPYGYFPPYVQQQPLSGSPLGHHQQFLGPRTSVPYGAPFASPPRHVSSQQSPPNGGGGGGAGMGQQQGGPLRHNDTAAIGPPADGAVYGAAVQAASEGGPRGAVAREGAPAAIWVGDPNASGHNAPHGAGPAVAASPPAMAKAAPSGGVMGSPQGPTLGGFLAAAAGGNALHGAVRHVVDELRTSPLILPSDYDTPGRGSIGITGGGRSTGGAAYGSGGGGGSGEKNAAIQRYQAQIVSLERQNAELQKRLTDTQSALEAARQARQALEAKQDAMADQVAQANHGAKSRESALESARRANDALSGELRSCQDEVAALRNALAAAKDTAVQWQDRAMEVGKELEAARKKIETLGEEERRLSSENMALRKEVQQLNDVIIKGRIESAELREKLRSSQQDAARAASTAQALASRVESEHEGAAVQMTVMRNKLSELESRNSQLLYDVSGLREEVSRARQAADAAKAALAAKPAGIASEGVGSVRQQQHHHHMSGATSAGWMGLEAQQPSGNSIAPGLGLGGGSGSGAYNGASYGGPYGGNIGNGYNGVGSSVEYSGPGFGAAGFGGGGPSGSVNGGGSGTASGNGGVGGGSFSQRPPAALPPPPQPGSFPSSHSGQATISAILRDLPTDMAFSKLDPETFRNMVRAEAEAMGRGGGGGGGDGLYSAASSPLKPSYGTRHGGGGGDLGTVPSSGALDGVALLPPPPPRLAWGDGPGRDLAAAPPPPPLPDARNMWRAPPPLADEGGFGGRGGGGGGASKAPNTGAANSSYATGRGVAPLQGNGGAGGGGGSGGSPPPYAVNLVDNPYAHRRPANAVGTGGAPPGGGMGSGNGGAYNGETPYGTEETVKDMIARSKALEDKLMVLCSEKGGLEAEYARMPLGAGRSLRERNRKQVVEQRLELLNKEISSVRMQLKRLGVK